MRRFKPEPRGKRRVLLLLGVYYPAHRDGIARYAHEAGWVLNNQYAQGGLAPVWWRADGMITLITHPRDYTALQRFPPRPLVDLSKGWVSNVMTPRQRRAGRDRPRVLEDNAAIGRMAAQHFIERGFRHIALVNIGNWWMETDRIPTFRAAVETAGGHYHEIAYHRHFIPGRTQRASTERTAHRWLTQAIRDLPKPVGIFASTDGLATQILDACDDAGVAVPEEAAVLGCDNESAMCQHAPVPLSSVDNDLEQQGYAAAQLLDRLMDGKPPPREPILIPPKGIVTRQSTNILAVPHAQVARALRFIWEHYPEPIRTPDIAAAAGLSRRGLERMFQQHLHRSVADEVTHCRIERAKKLLLETTKKAYEVAAESGFSSDMHFSRVFLRVTGLRPGRYRRTHAADS